MTDHDPLCPTDQNLDPACWFCALIAKVRAEYEGEREAWEETMRRYVSSVLADLRAKVEALPSMFADDESGGLVILSDVLALIAGSGE